MEILIHFISYVPDHSHFKTPLRKEKYLFSTVGWWEIIRKHSDIDVYFLPSLTIALQVAILFFFGLINLLPECAYVLYFIGYAALIRNIYGAHVHAIKKPYQNIGFFFLGISFICLALFVRGKVFIEYDNFSHWAVVVKRMLAVDRYPTFQDAIIQFQSYPLGSSTYIYYFSKMVSNSESVQMLAQAYMMLACFLPVFFFLKRNAIGGFFVALFSVNLILTYNVCVLDLLVDTLLPLAGMCGLLFSFLYCREESNAKKHFFAALYAIFVIQIKNSGIFFALMIFVLLLCNIKKGQLPARIAGVSVSVISFVLWQKHCDYVFKEAALTKHAFTISKLEEVISGKTAEDCAAIFKAMTKYSLELADMRLILLLFIVLGIIIVLQAKSQTGAYKKVLLASVIMYAVYQIGLLGMYLFSMPLNDALNLSGVSRYTRSIIIAILYLYTILAMKTVSAIDAEKRLPASAASVLISVAFCLFSLFSNGSIRCVVTHAGVSKAPIYQLRPWIDAVKIEYGIPNSKSYCILIPNTDPGYAYYLGRYVFQSTNVSAFSGVDSESTLDSVKSDYIFIYDDDNDIINDWISKNYPDQSGEKVIIREKNT